MNIVTEDGKDRPPLFTEIFRSFGIVEPQTLGVKMQSGHSDGLTVFGVVDDIQDNLVIDRSEYDACPPYSRDGTYLVEIDQNFKKKDLVELQPLI